MEEFFKKHTDAVTEEQKHELLFKIIQYIERQVVLFDSIEAVSYTHLDVYKRQVQLHIKLAAAS